MLEPFLFSSNRRLVAALGNGMVGAVVVDWERRGKELRQADATDRIGVDTQINDDGPDDLVAVVEGATVPVLCRLNAWSHRSREELDLAVRCGASEVIIPMVRHAGEVAAALEAADGRIEVGIMVETDDAVSAAAELARLPISRVYVGLMDLALDRGSDSIFDAVGDGTVERLRTMFDVPFGFAGLTVPGGGSPIPARLLAAEQVRLRCAFTFLRRSFIRDAGDEPAAAVWSIRRMIGGLETRRVESIERDHRALMALLAGTRRAARS